MHAYQKKKPHTSENVIKVGDVILIADSEMPRHRWELGIVEDLILRHDRLCLAAAVHTSKGHTTLSLVKLVPVELNLSDVILHNPVDNPNPVAPNVIQCQHHVP